MLPTLLLTASLAQLASSDLGVVGESCRARVDCQAGLRCVQFVCQAPVAPSNEGRACAARSECGDPNLRCINRVCTRPEAPPPPPEIYVDEIPVTIAPPAPSQPVARSAASAAAVPVITGELPSAPPKTPVGGTHFTLGVNALGGGYGPLPTGGLTVQAGWFFERAQLALSFGFHTGPLHGMLSVAALGGYVIPLFEKPDVSVGWILRGGLTADVGTLGLVGPRVDVLGLCIRTPRFAFEFVLPSAALMFGDATTVQLLAQATASYVF